MTREQFNRAEHIGYEIIGLNKAIESLKYFKKQINKGEDLQFIFSYDYPQDEEDESNCLNIFQPFDMQKDVESTQEKLNIFLTEMIEMYEVRKSLYEEEFKNL